MHGISLKIVQSTVLKRREHGREKERERKAMPVADAGEKYGTLVVRKLY